MALITRLSRLFSADLHAVLDRVEEPEIVLKQAIRDMQAALAATENRIDALRARETQLAHARTHATTRHRETVGELAVCLDAGNDDLARLVIQRKLELERHVAALEMEAERINRTLEEQERALATRHRELEALRSQSEVFDTPGRQDTVAWTRAAVTSDEVEVALLREKQRRAAS